MTVHLATNKDPGKTYCNAVDGQGKGIGTSTSFYFADCLCCLRRALNENKSGLQVIKGVLAEVGL